MCQLDEHFARLAVIGNEGKDLWGNAVYRDECVFDGPNNVQNLQDILFQPVDLRRRGISRCASVKSVFSTSI